MNFRIKKKYGQHFLKNKDIVKKIVEIENLSNEFVIEIGPGLGSLTKEIINQDPKKLVRRQVHFVIYRESPYV